ncbi:MULTISPECIES: GTP cyclohydrolase FolE2 [unclassified Halomonas]|uniref:GTP cyclohydrolase FolE2 n=1 Tax=unclassified Halomonas TaxID=2609666 RepID=UPI0007DA22FD|nr:MULTISPECIES: GTP cyclohydrolase FolE2 [unclassified Halomonas]MBT2786365.1 GTP cyclohydrolase I FolE2 [Halomonas sp. ISL-106]MBT2797387.1 GTP cyclohydrolase I FolE2 [Halomonas sp. ISL-104]OAL58754.1 GTP cyclohydrolase [Halomonas sp. ALS9]
MTVLTLPDIASQTTRLTSTLTWVGMEGIALPVQLGTRSVTAKLDAGVSLDDSEARGIHMSRLYLALAPLEDAPLTLPTVKDILSTFLTSQEGLSQQAYLTVEGELPLKRQALISPLAGWKSYPFSLRGQLTPAGFHVELGLTVGYSSTCPCSAALARQSIQQAFAEDFSEIPLTPSAVSAWLGSEEGILATPHSQRSSVECSLRLTEGENEELPIADWLERAVDRIEKALGTALQTAVKRIDEQAFALANGQNLMFCEDAARRVDKALRQAPGVAGFQLKVVHAESLHAHDAVARSEWNW